MNVRAGQQPIPTKRAAEAALFVNLEASRSRAAGAARCRCDATCRRCRAGHNADDTQRAQAACRACARSRTSSACTGPCAAAGRSTCSGTTDLVTLALQLFRHAKLAADCLNGRGAHRTCSRLGHDRCCRQRRGRNHERSNRRSKFTKTLHASLSLRSNLSNSDKSRPWQPPTGIRARSAVLTLCYHAVMPSGPESSAAIDKK
jgi:hypothetical protein